MEPIHCAWKTANFLKTLQIPRKSSTDNIALREYPPQYKNIRRLPVLRYPSRSISIRQIRECADIFLSINTEQKSVPRSLVFDFMGSRANLSIDPAALRARDIALFLNSDDSPDDNGFKLPGSPTRKGGIALSIAVTALKPLVEEKGSFEANRSNRT